NQKFRGSESELGLASEAGELQKLEGFRSWKHQNF
ncbi:hypothetical protein A2U01_0060236, partial [Trifolium medium]|nr:hypothetical protein [Trifolium medium]